MPETALPIKRSRLRRLTQVAVRTVALLLVLCALLIYAASWWASWKYSGSSFRFDTPSGPVTVLLGDLSVSPLQGLQATDVTVSAPDVGSVKIARAGLGWSFGGLYDSALEAIAVDGVSFDLDLSNAFAGSSGQPQAVPAPQPSPEAAPEPLPAWRAMSISISGSGRIRYGDYLLKVSELRITACDLGADLQAPVTLSLVTSQGETINATLSRRPDGKFTALVWGTGIDLNSLSVLLRSLDAGAVSFPSGTAELNGIIVFADTPHAFVELSLADTAISTAGWRTKRLDVTASARLEFSDTFAVSELKLAESRSGVSLTGALSVTDRLAATGLRVSAPDCAKLKDLWGLDFMFYSVKGSLEAAGDFALAFPPGGPTITTNCVATLKDIDFRASDPSFALVNAGGTVDATVRYGPLSTTVELRKSELSFDAFGTKAFAWRAPSPAVQVHGSVTIRGANTTIDFALDQQGIISATAKGEISSKGELKTTLNTPNLPGLISTVYRDDLDEYLKYFAISQGPLALSATLGPSIKQVSVHAQLPPLGLRTEAFSEDFGSIALNAEILLQDKEPVTLKGTLTGSLAYDPMSFSLDSALAFLPAGIAIDCKGSFGSVTDLAFAMKPADGKVFSASFRDADLDEVLGYLKRRKLIMDAGATVSGELEDARVSLADDGVLSVHGRLRDFGISYNGTEVSGVNAIASASFPLNDLTSIKAELDDLACASVNVPDTVSATGIAGQKLSAGLFLKESISGWLHGQLSAQEVTVMQPRKAVVKGFSYSGQCDFEYKDSVLTVESNTEFGLTLAEFGMGDAKALALVAGVSAVREDGSFPFSVKFDLAGYEGHLVENCSVAGTASLTPDGVSLSGDMTVGDSVLEFDKWEVSLSELASAFSLSSTHADKRLQVKSKLKLPFFDADVLLTSVPQSDRCEFSLSTSIAPVFEAVPHLQKLFPATIDGSLSASGLAHRDSTGYHWKGKLSLSYAEAEYEPFEFYGNDFVGAVEGSAQLMPDGSAVFDITAELTPGVFLYGADATILEIVTPIKLSARGSWDAANSLLKLDAFSISWERMFESVTLADSWVKLDGSCYLSGAVKALDLAEVLRTFHTSQLAPGEESLLGIAGVASGTFNLQRGTDGSTACSMAISVVEPSGYHKAFRGAQPLEFESHSTVKLSLEAALDSAWHGSAAIDLNTTATWLSRGGIMLEVPSASTATTLTLSERGVLAAGTVDLKLSMTVDGPVGIFMLEGKGIELSLPFQLANYELEPSDLRSGHLKAASLTIAGYEARELDLPITLYNNLLELPQLLELSAEGGGAIDLGPVRIEQITLPTRVGEAKLQILDAHTEVITRSLGLPIINGVATGSYEVILDGFTVWAEGSLELGTFGGQVSFGSLELVLGKYTAFSFDRLELKDIDLLEVTRPFEGFAASISGNLSGYIRDFKYAWDEPQEFRMWLETTPMSGREQIITAGIVNVIAMNSAEVRRAMSIFNLETFKYKYLKLGASLKQGRLRVSGRPEGAPGTAKEGVILMGQRSGFFRLIIRVAGNVEGDWRSVWGSFKTALKSMESGKSLEVVQ